MTFLARRVRRQAGRYVKTFVLSLAVASSVSAIGGCSGPGVGPAANLAPSGTASNATATRTQGSISASSAGPAISGSLSGLEYDRATQTFNAVMTLTNNGATSVSGPFTVVISTGSSAVTVAGSANGSTYIANVPGGTILPGHSAQVVVEFADPTHAQFTPTITSIVAGQPPSALSYPAPVPFLLGKAITPLTPTVTGTVTSYSIAPPLPAGISINATTGVISGTPSALSPATTYTISASNSIGHTSYGLQLQVDSGPTVHLSVAATDPNSYPLSYQWKATEGALSNLNGSQADWLLPSGPGLHFAYVLVSNGRGGHTERRIAVNTDTIGNPTIAQNRGTWSAPAAPTAIGDTFRNFVLADLTLIGGGFGGSGTGNLGGLSGGTGYLYGPNVKVILKNEATQATTAPVTTDLKGQFLVPNVLPGTYDIQCSFDGTTFIACGNGFAMSATASVSNSLYAANTRSYLESLNPLPFSGSMLMQDGNPCGTENEFFGVESHATAQYVDATSSPIGAPTSFNTYGNYLLLPDAGAAAIRFSCEGAPPVTTANLQPFFFPRAFTGLAAPLVSNMTATYNGTSLGAFLPPPSGLPSDKVGRRDEFLAYKGLDTRQSACAYYQTVGAVTACDPSGNPSGAISFDDWQRTVKIGPYAQPGTNEYTAAYVNHADLNLTRVHHSISYGPTQTAAYVCNHLGPTDAAGHPTQDPLIVDTVIDNAVSGLNTVACVAMDYSVTTGVNGNQPFMRFLIFSPNGSLLLSVNLDGRGEKFVPGTCVACHGGDHYTGGFPADGTGRANIGAHFLPYDIQNFLFSDRTPGLLKADQQAAIRALNFNVLNAGPTQAEVNLINALYANGPTFDETYVPALYQVLGANGIAVYRNVIQPHCRGCHVALDQSLNFNDFTRVANGNSLGVLCGSIVARQAYAMPNSLVTFNNFWGAVGTPADPLAALAAVYGNVYFGPSACPLVGGPP